MNIHVFTKLLKLAIFFLKECLRPFWKIQSDHSRQISGQ